MATVSLKDENKEFVSWKTQSMTNKANARLPMRQDTE